MFEAVRHRLLAAIVFGAAVFGSFLVSSFALQRNSPRSSEDSAPDRDSGDAIIVGGIRRSMLGARGSEAETLTGEEESFLKDNCKFGRPEKSKAAPFGPTKYVYRKGYVLESSLEDKMPLWVSEHSTADELVGDSPRVNKFRPDPKLKGLPRAELVDFKGSGYDRGHLAPAGNQTVNSTLKLETFFLSNMVAQEGPGFNRTIWAELEDTVRDWILKRGEGWIITGAFFYDPQEEDPSTADGFVDIKLIGPNQVAVPTHLFKIVIAPKPGGEELESIAFVMENKPYSKPFKLEKYLHSIDWIEEHTGLNFMPGIAEAGVPGLEDRLEGNTPTELWGD